MEQYSNVPIISDRRTLYKNIFALLFPMILICLAQKPVLDLQSSLNFEHGLGTTTMSVAHGCSMLFLIFLPPYIIGLIGAKRAIMVPHFLLTVFILVNIYPTWATLIPGTSLGFGFHDIAGVAQSRLNTEFGIRYGKLRAISMSQGVNFLSGIFCSSVHFGYVIGNLISFGILNAGVQLESNVTQEERLTCGVFFVETNHTETGHFHRPEKTYTTALFVTLAVTAIISVFGTGFLLDATPPKPRTGSTLRLCMSTLLLNRDWRFLCLFINNFHNGLVDVYVNSEVSKNFTTCLLGMQFVGIASTCFSTGNVTASFFYGMLSRRYGRLPLLFFYVLAEVALLLFGLYWNPSFQYDYVTVFVQTFLWGWVTSGTHLISTALHGILQVDQMEASYANMYLAGTCGMMVANGYSHALSLDIKIYIMLGAMALSFVTLFTVEMSLRNSVRSTTEINKKDNLN